MRAAVFLFLGLSAIVPTIHYIFKLKPEEYVAFTWLMITYVLQVIALLFFATHYPEKKYPGKFDVWFSSHQIFHVFTVLATLAYFRFMYIGVQIKMSVFYNDTKEWEGQSYFQEP